MKLTTKVGGWNPCFAGALVGIVAMIGARMADGCPSANPSHGQKPLDRIHRVRVGFIKLE